MLGDFAKPLFDFDLAARGSNTRHRQIEIEERLGGIAGGILDRQAGDARVHAEPDVVGDVGRGAGIAAFEIGIDRQIHGTSDVAKMDEHEVKRHRAIGVTLRVGEPGTRGGQGLEAETGEISRAAGVPGIWDDEAAALMKDPERVALVDD